jgi:hypothetical protein
MQRPGKWEKVQRFRNDLIHGRPTEDTAYFHQRIKYHNYVHKSFKI